MENHVPLPQPVAGAVRHHFDLALVHVEQFPKIVFFSFKDIVFGVFKIMHRHDGVDRHLPPGDGGNKLGHTASSSLFERPDAGITVPAEYS